MYAVSPGFLQALRSPSMTITTRVLATDQNGNQTELSVTGGAVSMDATRSIVRTCQLSLVATATLSLQQVYDLVMSPNVEITVERGLLVNGLPERVPLGVFSTDSAQFSRRVAGTISWNGSDRSKKIARARFVSPYQITAGTSLAAAITTLLRSRWAFTPVSLGNVTQTVSSNVIFEAGASSDPWREARALMADYGFDLNFDGTGTARAQSIPDPSTATPVFDYGTGETNLVTDATVSGSFDRTYNGVIASGEGSNIATPVQAVVWDADPNSPTYYLSGFGQVPYFYSSPQLTTVEQCELAANTILARVKGRAQGLSWSSVVNPALEPLDVVTTSLRGVTSRVVIDQLSIPLTAAAESRAIARETSTT